MDEPHEPKFKKRYVSWMGRAESMKNFLESQGFSVEYEADKTEIIGWSHSYFTGQGNQPAPKPEPVKRKWWQFWK